MIVIFGPTEDCLVREVTTVLKEQGHSIVMALPEDVVFESHVIWHVGLSQDFQLNQTNLGTISIPFSSVTAILWRGQFPLSSATTENWSLQDRDYMAKEGSAALLGILQDCRCPVINQPIPGGRSRFFFADYIWKRLFEEHSIGLPPMCLATSKILANEWSQEVHGTIRIVPMATSVFERLMAPNDQLGFMDWEYTKSPLCLQAISQGQWFHVINIGSEVRGGPIVPQVGYGSFVTGVELQSCPSSLVSKCLALGHAYGLEFSESLWLEDGSEQWYCLDWNSFPQAEHWGSTMQQEIPKLLARLLIDTQ